LHVIIVNQGCPQDVKSQDRDETETNVSSPSRDRDVQRVSLLYITKYVTIDDVESITHVIAGVVYKHIKMWGKEVGGKKRKRGWNLSPQSSKNLQN